MESRYRKKRFLLSESLNTLFDKIQKERLRVNNGKTNKSFTVMWVEIISILFGAGGILTGAVVWISSKRQRDNDFIAKLQTTINNLSTSYTSILNKQIEMERQNMELLISQNKIEKQNEELIVSNDDLKTQNDKLINNQEVLEAQNKELLRNQIGLKQEVEMLRRENKNLIEKVKELNKFVRIEKPISKSQQN